MSNKEDDKPKVSNIIIIITYFTVIIDKFN